ncbi:MAG: alanyl-tRNA editing protein [Acidobacteria bacterium]|nr:alanyl-tRNA editing protein [Thermoanaerobaculia bacterium]MDI9631840.1 alanyl-tRNA editing protein [Acidobacteriota bacterium]MBP7813618.1 alanyl-tRNA editing protein [Thermoanaerobaculia bacterium]MBP8844439.1 alanyl-tRNA editing protein [Thermoanaerobaculia bacterium]NLN10518.1 alanyl-tRNA editing protein [Acidobacteriota bacterium]
MRSPAFHRDPYARELAVTVRPELVDGQPAAWLADTILFPGGGGQPADRGRLGGVEVTAVERSDEGFLHRLAAPLPAGPARLELDWEHRYDLMQQHTAQHLLTAIALTRFGWRTTAFHLGPALSDIELDRPAFTAAELAALEEAVAAEVRAARRVSARWVTPEQAAELGVRTRRLPAGHTGDLRVIEIAGLDLATCGGTHLVSTAEIEVLKLVGTEPMRGGTRLFWLAGGRVRARLGEVAERLGALRRLFDSGEPELCEIAARKLEELAAAGRLTRRLGERLAELEAERLARAPGPLLELHLESPPPGGPAALAAGIVADRPEALAFVTAAAGDGLVFGLAAGDGLALDLAPLGAEVARTLGGRGGGTGRRFQGKAATATHRAEAIALLGRTLS